MTHPAELSTHLGRLEDARLIRRMSGSDEPAYVFKHALTQDVAYGSLLHSQRRDLHRSVARAFERLPDACEDELAPVLAYHYAEAGDDAQTLRYATVAGDAAADRYAQAEAIAHYDRALGAAERAGATSEQFVHLYTRRGRLLELSGRFAEAMASYEEMARIALQRRDKSLELSSLLLRAIVRSVPNPLMDIDIGIRLASQSLELAQALGDRAAESKALWILHLATRFVDYDLTIEYVERSIAIAHELDLREQLALDYGDAWSAYWAVGDLAQARHAQDEAVRLWRKIGNVPMIASGLTDRGMLSLLVGEWDAILEGHGEVVRLSTQSGNLWSLTVANLGSGSVNFMRGNVGAGLSHLHAALELSHRSGLVIGPHSLRVALAEIHEAMGDVPGAVALLREAVVGIDALPTVMRTMALSVPGRLKHLEGDLTAASQLLASGMALYDRRNVFAAGGLTSDTWAAELALAVGDTARVIGLADELAGPRWRQLITGFLPRLQMLKARALLMESRPDEAYATLQEARALAERTRWRQLLWQIYGLLAALERAGGDRERAADMQSRARETIGYILEHTDSAALRESFLARPEVAEIMA